MKITEYIATCAAACAFAGFVATQLAGALAPVLVMTVPMVA